MTYKTIELFAGGGGMALGFEGAGFENLLMNEWDRHAVATLRKNRPEWNVLHKSIVDVDFGEYKGKVDVLTGGFPCQAFSTAGKRLGFNDVRGTMFFQFARAAQESQPKIVIGENVRGLTFHDKGRTLQTVNSVFDELGYIRVFQEVVDAYDFCVAQKRKRFISAWIRKDLHRDGMEFSLKKSDRHPSVRDVLKSGDIYDTDAPATPGKLYSPKKFLLMEKIPEGGCYVDLSEEDKTELLRPSLSPFTKNNTRNGTAARLSWDKPSHTLITFPVSCTMERCHPEETRPLSVREYARIQSFPDTWDFQGPIGAQYKQIGNAVPVNLARAIADATKNLLDGL